MMLCMTACERPLHNNSSAQTSSVLSESARPSSALSGRSGVGPGASSAAGGQSSRPTDISSDLPFPLDTGKPAKNIPESECRQVSFYYRENKKGLVVSLPSAWSFKKSAVSPNIYEIMSGKTNIGKVIVNTMWNPSAEVDITAIYEGIEKTGQKRIYTYSNGKKSATRCLFFFSELTSLSLITSFRIEVDACEMDDETATRILDTGRIAFSSGMGKALLDEGKDNRVLVLGNSFVVSSQIGQMLELMVRKAGLDTTVYPESRGYYSVSLYTQDTGLMKQIASGAYDVVFLCGFYSYSDVAAFSEFEATCKKGGATVVITPAHNEPHYYGEAAAQYPETAIANWKELINILISSGYPESYFCINDTYKHTNVIGGYAGACMLYTVLFNKKPPSVYEEVSGQFYELGQLGLGQSEMKALFGQIEKAAYSYIAAADVCYEV